MRVWWGAGRHNRVTGRLAMISLAGLLIAAPSLAATQSVRILGGRLFPNPIPERALDARRVNILVTNLPAHWADGAGACHTVDSVANPHVHFTYWDGVRGSKTLTAQGYGPNPTLGRNSLEICRDASGAITSFGASVTLYVVNTGIGLCGVGVSSTAAGHNSSAQCGEMAFGHAVIWNAGSSAANVLTISP